MTDETGPPAAAEAAGPTLTAAYLPQSEWRKRESKRTRQARMSSQGWTEEGERLLAEARTNGVCAQCGVALRSKLPPGSPGRRAFCFAKGCNDRFYETHYRAWHLTKRAVLRRVKAAHGGEVRCENCGKKPEPILKSYKLFPDDAKESTYEAHCGYEFDHIAEVAAGGDALDTSNVWILCLPCHRRKTARFARRGTPSGRVVIAAGNLDAFVDPSADGESARSARAPSSHTPSA